MSSLTKFLTVSFEVVWFKPVASVVTIILSPSANGFLSLDLHIYFKIIKKNFSKIMRIKWIDFYQVAVGTGKPLYDVSRTKSSPFLKLETGSKALSMTGGALKFKINREKFLHFN